MQLAAVPGPGEKRRAHLHPYYLEDPIMSIIRVGLAETKNFSEGYDMIFGKKDNKDQAEKTEQKSEATPAEPAQQEKK
jgi:hypothetical protein